MFKTLTQAISSIFGGGGSTHFSKTDSSTEQVRYADGEDGKAVQSIEAATQQQSSQNPPESYDEWVERAAAYAMQHDYEQAIHDYTKASDIAPHLAHPLFCRGMARQFLKQADLALADFNAALQLEPEHTMTLTYRGTLFMTSFRNYDLAQADFEKALALDNGSVITMEMYAGAINLLSEADTDTRQRAIELAYAAYQQSGKRSSLETLEKAYQRAGDVERAEKIRMMLEEG